MKLIRFFLLFAHLLIVFLLLGTLLNSFIPPKVFPYLNLLSLVFPILMVLHILLCLVWIFLWKKRAFFFLLISIFFFNPSRRWVNFTHQKKETANLKILTFNTHTGYSNFKKISDFIDKEKPDIAILQEVAPNASAHFYKTQITEFPILFLGTNLEVVNYGSVDNTGTNGNCFFADVKINGKTIRIINVYLSPFMLDKQTVKPEKDIRSNKAKVSYMLHKLIPTFKIHQEEVKKINEFVKSSPFPVILCGDFNSVPNSYEYYRLGDGLKDAFLEAGNGSATSFHDYKYPIRIDYAFCSESIEPISYKVDHTAHLSDHFPVLAEFRIK